MLRPDSWAPKPAPQKLRITRVRLDIGPHVKTRTIRPRNESREPLNRHVNLQEERCHAPSSR